MHRSLSPLLVVAEPAMSAVAMDDGSELDNWTSMGTFACPFATGHFMPSHFTVPRPKGIEKVFG